MRSFESGATRDSVDEKPDYEGFLSPLVWHRFGRYMHEHRLQDGQLRSSDNWQQGIPRMEYLKSLLRHVMDLWLCHRGYTHLAREDVEEACCAILFNAQGYLYECLRDVNRRAETNAPSREQRQTP